MDRANEKLMVAERACATLTGLLSAPQGDPVVMRDAAILRFIYSFETAWKAAQAILAKFESIEAATPRLVVQSCWKANILAEHQADALLKMITDRNLTVHAYDETLAIELARRIPGHAAQITAWLAALRGRLT